MYFLFAIVFVLLAVLWWIENSNKSHPVNKFRGPATVPFFGTLLPFLKGRDAAYLTMRKHNTEFKPLYRTWQGPIPNMHFNGPSYIETLLSNTTHINKSFDYMFLAEWLGTGLLISNGAKWHARRKLLTPAFHFKILEQFVPIFSENTKILVKKLKVFAEKNESVDIVPHITHCALDIICETAMGTSINAQEDEDSSYVKAIYQVNDLLIYRVVRPWLWPKFLFKLSSQGRKFYECIEVLHSFTKKVIQDRKAERSKEKSKEIKIDENETGKRRVAFLDILLDASESNALTDEDIREEVDTFMFEGHDTTAMAMSWCLFHLGNNPAIQDKCFEELVGIFGDSDSSPLLKDLNEMKYLERVIKESLRLCPSVPLIARQTGAPITIENVTLPTETKVNVSIFSLHTDPDIFPDPEKFDPDRFLIDNCNTRHHPYAYIPFSAGPRNCIGQKFAMLEMKNLLSTLIRKFIITSVDPEHYKTPLPDIIFRPKYGIKLLLSNRSY